MCVLLLGCVALQCACHTNMRATRPVERAGVPGFGKIKEENEKVAFISATVWHDVHVENIVNIANTGEGDLRREPTTYPLVGPRACGMHFAASTFPHMRHDV